MRRILVLLFLLILLFTSQSSGQEPTYRQVEVFTDNCMKIIQSSNFDEAARSFHYPPNYSPEELEKDRNGVKLGLMELCKIFGTVQKAEIVQRPMSFYNVTIGGGDTHYWQRNPQFIKVTYETTFSREGEGFVVFQVVQLFNKLELRSASFGIPISSPNAKNRMEKIFVHMMNFMKSLKNGPEIKKM